MALINCYFSRYAIMKIPLPLLQCLYKNKDMHNKPDNILWLPPSESMHAEL